MAAGLGFKTFNTGDVLSAADVNGYLMQGVLVFADATARDAAITSPQEGQFAYTKNNDSLWYYSGSAWVASGATGDIEGVTAGTGISGGGTSGTVTITNSMATEIDAKGDLIVGTGADTFSRLAVGATNGHTLQVDSSTSTGLKWAAASAGGMTLLSTTTLSGSETSISISDTSYINLCILIEDWQLNANGTLRVRLNSLNGDPNYCGWGGYTRAYDFNNGATPLSGDALYISQQTFVSGNKANSGFLNIYNYANTNSWKLIDYTISGASTTNDAYAITQMGSFSVATASAISSFQFITTSTFDGGTVKIYGVK